MVQNRFRPHRKIWIRVAAAAGILIVLLLVASAYLASRWKPLAGEKIREAVHNGSKGLYNITYREIGLNVLTGSVRLNDVTIEADTQVYRRMVQAGTAPENVFSIKLSALRINRTGLLRTYFKKHLRIRSIVLDEPAISMVNRKVPSKNDTSEVGKSLYELIRGNLKSIQVDALKISRAKFDYIDANGKKRVINAFRNLNIQADDILIDSLSGKDRKRFYYSRNIGFNLGGYRSVTKDRMYTLRIDSVAGSFASSRVYIKGLQLIPNLPELAFSRKYQVQKDRYDLSFREIALSGIDFRQLDTKGKLQARLLRVGPASVAVFMNRELPPPVIDKGRNYPHVALKRLSLPLQIDTVRLQGVDLKYSEYNPVSRKTGSVRFVNLHGDIRNVTNDSLRLRRDHLARADFKTLLMGSGAMRVKINFDLNSENGAFTYSGSIGRFDMRKLNDLAINLGLVAIDAGIVDKGDFNVTADRRRASGNFNFYYHGLKIKLLKEQQESSKLKQQGLLSSLANNLLIKDANPMPGEPLRPGRATYLRANTASFFNLMWKTLFAGMREAVGVGFVPMKTQKQAQDKISRKMEQRSERAERRAQRRAERKAKRNN
ncbi:hypothetical protein C7T94_01195 [Pedobacter yulinensis]|uniref:DUF748 domain-containing protein n=1 Tax=Pedobacter yulinensis TaxID=2126353 RepID=A0A2T3HQU6_9SPHI|nr:hypothetical protein [Pedobacter yulinensis]PST84771.1 hypothetical protein C7T94_01195 [Pedobacter yulinensis]